MTLMLFYYRILLLGSIKVTQPVCIDRYPLQKCIYSELTCNAESGPDVHKQKALKERSAKYNSVTL